MNFDGSFLVGTDYTIFVIFQRRNGGVNGSGSIIGRLTTTALNQSIELGHFADSGGHAVFAFGQGDPNNYYVVGSANPTIPAFSTPSPALHVIVNSTIASGQSTFAHYYNGYRSSNIRTASTLTSIGTPSAMQSLISFPDAIIGHDITMDTLVGRAHLNGDLGEIIIYTRALKNEERIVVEDYLMQKWGISEL
jgi:hypothetical protein